ncbi:nucleobase-ascorbate transporter 7-like isoform X1 [Hibiscus syriacus]|uniref:Nucleobase-ascorbate transporter 7-like isoform X1 n=1 Tax=Hibiscus syriacus TaxID=106335 RepID=A0A6A3B8S5_HIBSY|nr:nucleobase-ascorbate transporter 7-like isoform X1 [Hibiscus syriacus]
MGNCQAVDAAALVIQHPSGRLERTSKGIEIGIRGHEGHESKEACENEKGIDEKLQQHGQENPSSGRNSDAENTDQELKQERQSSRTTPASAAAMRSKSWRPSLQSISEAAS